MHIKTSSYIIYLLFLFIGIVFIDIGDLALRVQFSTKLKHYKDNSLSSVLDYNGGSEEYLYRQLRECYRGRSLILPSDDLFSSTSLTSRGGFSQVIIDGRKISLSKTGYTTLFYDASYVKPQRLIYNPAYSPLYDRTKSLPESFKRPVSIYIMAASPNGNPDAPILGLWFENTMYFVPQERLLLRLQ